MKRALRAAKLPVAASARVTLRVPFHDVDAAQVVWHGHYAKYFEIARCALLDGLGYGQARMLTSPYFWPVVQLDARYVQPLRMDQEFDVLAELLESELRLRIRYTLSGRPDGTRIAVGETVQVAVRRDTGALCIGLPEEFRECVPAC